MVFFYYGHKLLQRLGLSPSDEEVEQNRRQLINVCVEKLEIVKERKRMLQDVIEESEDKLIDFELREEELRKQQAEYDAKLIELLSLDELKPALSDSVTIANEGTMDEEATLVSSTNSSTTHGQVLDPEMEERRIQILGLKSYLEDEYPTILKEIDHSIDMQRRAISRLRAELASVEAVEKDIEGHLKNQDINKA
eukprot:ANDGO_02168.mRNA.1 hypothetical protein